MAHTLNPGSRSGYEVIEELSSLLAVPWEREAREWENLGLEN